MHTNTQKINVSCNFIVFSLDRMELNNDIQNVSANRRFCVCVQVFTVSEQGVFSWLFSLKTKKINKIGI